LGVPDFMWCEPPENEWSDGDSESMQEQLDARRQGCLSTDFFLTLTSFAR